MTKQELLRKDRIVSPLIVQRQSPYHIITNHPELEMSVRTLYTYLDSGLFTARNINLKRKLKSKLCRCHKTQITNRTVFIGRAHANFQALSSETWTADGHSAFFKRIKTPTDILF